MGRFVIGWLGGVEHGRRFSTDLVHGKEGAGGGKMGVAGGGPPQRSPWKACPPRTPPSLNPNVIPLWPH
jgi:hypothetical protein